MSEKFSKMSFKNQSVIVTGGSSGIGRATCLEFAKRGANVVVSDINVAGGEETVQIILDNGGQAIFVKADVSNLQEVQHLIDVCIEKYGRLDHLVNNAGIGLGLKYFDQITDEQWHKVIAVNQTGVFYCMRAALRIMRPQRSGNIVNIASAAGIGAAYQMGAYAASKHAVIGMTKTAAVEFAKYSIRINAICPTVITTPMGDGYISSNPKLKDIMLRTVPMRRFGKPEEVAKTICWLCSEDASYLTGIALPVDGGSNA